MEGRVGGFNHVVVAYIYPTLNPTFGTDTDPPFILTFAKFSQDVSGHFAAGRVLPALSRPTNITIRPRSSIGAAFSRWSADLAIKPPQVGSRRCFLWFSLEVFFRNKS